jgi:HEAT repeat protein
VPRFSKPRVRRGATVLLSALLAVALLGLGTPAYADNLGELSKTLESSSHHKARIAAAVSLGRLRDVRALEPLVGALKDSHRSVRAVAAAALGHLGDARALPALQRATKDDDKIVRKRATEAIAAIRSELAKDSARSTRKTRKGKAGFGRANAAAAQKVAPTMFLSLQSTTDRSRDEVKDKIRKARANRLRRWMLTELAGTPQVTLSKTRAGDLDLHRFNIDVSIIGFEENVRGPYVEIECKLRVAISNERGKMLSFLTGGAKVQVTKRSYRRKYLYRLQLEALENAVKGIHQDVISHLARLNHS